MKRRILAAALLSVCLLTSCTKQTVSSKPQTTDPDHIRKLSGETSGDFRSAQLTPEVEAACAAAIRKMKLMRHVQQDQAVNSMASAQRLVWRNINIATLVGPRACVEYKGWFLISRLDWAKPDDGSFRSGIAVKKGTTDIYGWK